MKFFQTLKNITAKDIAIGCVATVLTFVTYTGVQNIVPQEVMAKQVPLQQQTSSTLASVGALMMLPSGEEPKIFNVSDSASLKAQQGFFIDAENGDVLIVYAKSGKAIIYNPTKNLIVNVGPVTFGDNNIPAVTQ